MGSIGAQEWHIANMASPSSLSVLDVLYTAVDLELLARSLPCELTVDELGDDVNDLISLADQLRRAVTFTVLGLAQGSGPFKISPKGDGILLNSCGR